MKLVLAVLLFFICFHSSAQRRGITNFCSRFTETQYRLVRTGNKLKITRISKTLTESFTAVIQHGRIYSANPDERGVKQAHGKYYKMQEGYFGVLNMENGDYDWFSDCSKSQ